MRCLSVIISCVVIAAPVLSQTAPKAPAASKPTAGSAQAQPVRVPASPITGTSFVIDRPVATVQDENAPKPTPGQRVNGSLIDLAGQSPLISSPLTGSVLAPIAGPYGLLQPGDLTTQTTAFGTAPAAAGGQPAANQPNGMQMLDLKPITLPMLDLKPITLPMLSIGGSSGQSSAQSAYSGQSARRARRMAPRPADKPASKQ